MAADIYNAYLQAPLSEKYCIICGPEFGLENIGKFSLIKQEPYGGKVAGRYFWNHFRSCMDMIELESCLVDPDIFKRAANKPDG